MKDSLIAFLENGSTAYHVTSWIKSALKKNGYQEVKDYEPWRLSPFGKYFTVKNDSSIIAFALPQEEALSFQIAAAHNDSPCFRIKESKVDAHYTRLTVEKYGGMLCSTWFDRPLAVAGCVMGKKEEKVIRHLVRLAEPLVIPSVAIHQNREANDKALSNPVVDLLPLFGDQKQEKAFLQKVAVAANLDQKDILAEELYLIADEKPFVWNDGEWISSPRLDDLQCVYALLDGFLKATPNSAVSVLAIFDNEEVGSVTAQGADSTFLSNTLMRIAEGIGKTGGNYLSMLASSFAVSADNAHAVHPNHPELSDHSMGACYMNGGIVLKETATKRYTTDAFSKAMFELLCAECGVPTQYYHYRADQIGGSTLAYISNSHVSVPTVDLGLAQLAMHSAVETAGLKDVEYLIQAMKEFFSVSLARDGEEWYWKK